MNYVGEEIEDLADLCGMAPETANVVVLAEHRQSCDGPSAYGPYKTAAKARSAVIAKYRSGDFDVDGCTVTYQVAR